jgi:succinoglycan biosynthesis protein ExoU
MELRRMAANRISASGTRERGAMNGPGPGVCVVIAGFNAETTVARAIQSALAEPEVTEVVVVDDASTDATVEVARQCEDASGRLKLIRLEQNHGPAGARNIAFRSSSAPLISILDADDFFLPGRFARMLAEPDWDMIADNIVFVAEDCVAGFDSAAVRHFEPEPHYLSLAEFVLKNISTRGSPRAELGFLKPLIRREFLEARGLAYDEDMRLGEDYELYVRALIGGARFKVIKSCGYVAVERPTSLSGLHATEDHAIMARADEALMQHPELSAEGRAAITRHHAHIMDKYRHRRFLDRKRESGFAGALWDGLSDPLSLPRIATAITLDRVDATVRRRADPPPAHGANFELRYLFGS